MILSHKIRLDPNQEQISYFRRACGIQRFSYNWALKESERLFKEEGIKTSGFDLSKRFNAIKYEEFPFVTEVTKWAVQKGIYNFWDGMKNWFSKRSKHPKLKKKFKSKDTFYLGLDSFKITSNKLHIPLLNQEVKMFQKVRFQGKQKSVTISREGKRWYVAVSVELEDSYIYPNVCETQTTVGIDLGIKTLMTFSNGDKVNNPQFMKTKEAKLRHLQRNLSRKKKFSKNWYKGKDKLSEEYRKIANAKSDFYHKATTEIVSSYKWIGIEDLAIKNMIKNHKLAKSIQGASFFEIRRQLEYKSKLSGSHVVIVDKWFPSSKLCNVCSTKKEKLDLSERSWTCTECNSLHDRDINAAKNLEKVSRRYRDTVVNACGGDVSPLVGLDVAKGCSVETGIKLPIRKWIQS